MIASRNDQRAVSPYCVYSTGNVPKYDAEGKGSAEKSGCRKNGLDRITRDFVEMIDELCCRLGVGFGYEGVAEAFQHRFDLSVVLDYAVMDE